MERDRETEDPQLGVRIFNSSIGSPANPSGIKEDDWYRIFEIIDTGEADRRLAKENVDEEVALRIRGLASLTSDAFSEGISPRQAMDVNEVSLGQVVTTEEGTSGVVVGKDPTTGRVRVRKDDTGEEEEFEAEYLQPPVTASVVEKDEEVEWL